MRTDKMERAMAFGHERHEKRLSNCMVNAILECRRPVRKASFDDLASSNAAHKVFDDTHKMQMAMDIFDSVYYCGVNNRIGIKSAEAAKIHLQEGMHPFQTIYTTSLKKVMDSNDRIERQDFYTQALLDLGKNENDAEGIVPPDAPYVLLASDVFKKAGTVKKYVQVWFPKDPAKAKTNGLKDGEGEGEWRSVAIYHPIASDKEAWKGAMRIDAPYSPDWMIQRIFEESFVRERFLKFVKSDARGIPEYTDTEEDPFVEVEFKPEGLKIPGAPCLRVELLPEVIKQVCEECNNRHEELEIPMFKAPEFKESVTTFDLPDMTYRIMKRMQRNGKACVTHAVRVVREVIIKIYPGLSDLTVNEIMAAINNIAVGCMKKGFNYFPEKAEKIRFSQAAEMFAFAWAKIGYDPERFTAARETANTMDIAEISKANASKSGFEEAEDFIAKIHEAEESGWSAEDEQYF